MGTDKVNNDTLSLFELTSGKTILAKRGHVDSLGIELQATILLIKPMVLVNARNSMGQMGVQLVPWLGDRVHLNADLVVGELAEDVPAAMQQAYLEATTEIALATMKDLPQQ